MRILTVVGNRPQFVKAAPVSAALRRLGLDEVVVHTGQHYDHELSQVFFDELGLAPAAYALELHTADPDPMQHAIALVQEHEQPDLVLVYGDTSSTLAGARAARAGGTPLAHVEAGLRSGDLGMPEERARIEVDSYADLLLCPDERSAVTLRKEGVPGRAEVVGDVMADVAERLAPLARTRSRVLERFDLEPGRYVLATIHREANVGEPRLGRIVDGLNRLTEPIVLPAHPRTAEALERHRLGAHVALAEPLGYLDLAALASQARVVVTDSGGLQKEAYWYGVPCVTARPSTEWADTVAAGANVLVDDDPDRLAAAVAGARMPASRPPLYGDGRAAGRVARLLADSTLLRR